MIPFSSLSGFTSRLLIYTTSFSWWSPLFVAGLFAVAAWQFSFFVHNRIFTYTIMFLVVHGIEYLLILTPDWPLHINEYLLGYYPGGQTYVGMALCIIFYLALALLPALIVPKKLKNCL